MSDIFYIYISGDNGEASYGFLGLWNFCVSFFVWFVNVSQGYTSAEMSDSPYDFFR